MVFELKLRKIGDSVGFVLPEEALAHLKAGEGDEAVLTQTPEGGLRLSASSNTLSRQMNAALSIMDRYRNTPGELDK